METKTLHEQLLAIQQKLDAPKTHYSDFGGYYYRSCEDILTAVKPFLKEYNLTIYLNDEMVNLGERYYVKATATISNGKEEITTTAFGREALSKPKMDEAQVTGSASSYARKYALNGLLAIDDVKDADTMDNTKETQTTAPVKEYTREQVAVACQHPTFWVNEVKQGQNQGRFFKKCRTCGAFMSWTTKPEVEEPLPVTDEEKEQAIDNF